MDIIQFKAKVTAINALLVTIVLLLLNLPLSAQQVLIPYQVSLLAQIVQSVNSAQL